MCSSDLTFDESVKLGSSGTITLHDLVDDSVVAAFDVTSPTGITVSGSEIAIDIDGLLNDDTSYYVIVTTGAIVDSVGNPFAGISDATTLGFTMTETIPPSLSNTSPSNDATLTPLGSNIVLTFSETVSIGN